MEGDKLSHARSLCNELSSSRQSGAAKSAPKVPKCQRDLCGPDPTGYLTQQQYLRSKPDANRQSPHVLEYLVHTTCHHTAMSWCPQGGGGLKSSRREAAHSLLKQSPVHAKRIPQYRKLTLTMASMVRQDDHLFLAGRRHCSWGEGRDKETGKTG